MKVPYCKQEFSWSCFAACTRMVLEFLGVRKEEKELRTLLRITPYTGGAWYYVELGLETLGLQFYWSYGFSLKELKELVYREIPVIVSFKQSPNKDHSNHVVVVVDVTDAFIKVHDPEEGENVKINTEQFLEMWGERNNIAGYVKSIRK